MEQKYSSRNHLADVDSALSLPHFDEDATLLSARPVVPLHEVKAVTRSRRRVIFGLTILAAILVGAISATLLFMPNGQNSEIATEADVSQPTMASSGAAGGSTSESAERRVPVLREPDGEPLTRQVPNAGESTIKNRPPAAISRNSAKPVRAARPDYEQDQDFETEEMELRRAERRNARREARRQLRNRREQTGDDLLRIREIFEGPPRP